MGCLALFVTKGGQGSQQFSAPSVTWELLARMSGFSAVFLRHFILEEVAAADLSRQAIQERPEEEEQDLRQERE
jgi:hypothetical protein